MSGKKDLRQGSFSVRHLEPIQMEVDAVGRPSSPAFLTAVERLMPAPCTCFRASSMNNLSEASGTCSICATCPPLLRRLA